MVLRLILLAFLVLLLRNKEVLAQKDLLVRKVVFSGNDSLSKHVLRSQIFTSSHVFPKTIAFWKKPKPYYLGYLDEDILRLKRYYQRNGFLKPVITYRLKKIGKGRKYDVIFNITEGLPIQVGEIRFELLNSDDLTPWLDSLKKRFPLKTYSRFRDEDVIEGGKKIHNSISDKGYPYIRVNTDVTLRHYREIADVDYIITPGNRCYLGKIDIRGDSMISRSYLDKQISLKSGQLFSQTKLEETQKELFDLALFRYVTIRALMDQVKNDSIPVIIQLKELPRWSFKTGVGYGTEDNVRITVWLKRLNFFNNNSTLIFKGGHSQFVPLNIELKFIKPHLWRKNLDLILNPFFSREREDSYKVDRWGSSISLQRVFSRETSAFFSYSYGNDKVTLRDYALVDEETTPETKSNIKSGITFGYLRNTSNHMFFPSKGWKFNGTVIYMGIGSASDFHYYKLIAEFANYSLLTKRLILAGKLKVGVMEPTRGDDKTPIEDRFLMGGALSLRGWGRNQISPVDERGNRLGGNSLLEGSVEVRFPLWGVFSGVSFVDAGNVWSQTWKLDPGDLYYDAGLGVRIKTPVGPVRLDVASPVFDQGFTAQFFVSIGHAF